MNGSAVEELALQAKTLIVSALGLIALIPGPDQKGNLRVKGVLGSAITYLGIVLLLAPWITLPFLPQPRYVGSIRLFLQALGVLFLVLAITLYATSLRHLLPAFREHFSEFTPSSLVVSGPYRAVRHPIYLSCLIIITGLCLVRSASLSILFLPILWALLRGVSLYEERNILIPKFGDEYLQYRRNVRRAILGPSGGILAACLYIPLSSIALIPLLAR
jgi:protein-S-isoprenylcysteine O-methyltransferase Ste14